MLIPSLQPVTALALAAALLGGPKDDSGGKKEKKEQGPSIVGVVKSVDAGKNSLTVIVMVGPKEKKTEERTFELAKDAKVVLENALTKEQPAGKLADLTAGTGVTVQLAADKKTAIAVSARGAGFYGTIKTVDATTNTLTVSVKEDGKLVDKTLTLAKGAKVLLNDGLKKDQKDKEAALTDLSEGTAVLVQPTVDRKTALAVRVQGPAVHGTVKGVDLGNNTITVTVKEDAQVVDKTLDVSKDVRSDRKLGDLAAGTRVTLQLSVFDKKTVVGVHVHE